MGLETEALTREDRLCTYNLFIADKMQTLPFNNYIKSTISYQTLFTVELFNRLNNNEIYENIISDYKEIWKKRHIEKGKELLVNLKIIGTN